MSTIEEVRAAEKKVQRILEELKKAKAQDPNQLTGELQKATDEYSKDRKIKILRIGERFFQEA